MVGPTHSPIIEVAARWLAPAVQLIGLYVFFHGHYGPGGGFQGGVLLAAGVLLLRMSMGATPSQAQISSRTAIICCSLGALLFVLTGLAALGGGNFMDYEALPVAGLEGPLLRYYGILFVEVGITLAVMTGLVAIYDDLLGINNVIDH